MKITFITFAFLTVSTLAYGRAPIIGGSIVSDDTAQGVLNIPFKPRSM